jgi:sec-independent protein translocase protein TatA
VFDLSPIHLILALGICLVIAGPKRLPELGKSLGRSMREFRSSLGGLDASQLPPAAAEAVDEKSTSTEA